MTDALETLFGESGPLYEGIVKCVGQDADAFNYEFMDLGEYHALRESNPREAQKVYWREMLRRAHFGAIGSTLRISRWLQGVRLAMQSTNYALFCAALRSFLEACADSHYSLGSVPRTLAENYRLICLALHGKAIQFSAENRELEDSLIHFSHARKLGKAQRNEFPEIHNAKPLREYVESLAVLAGAGAHDLYGELCDVTHPGLLSLNQFIGATPKRDDLIQMRTGQDAKLIADLSERYRETAAKVLMVGCNAPLLIMGLINTSKNRWLRTPSVEKLHLDTMGQWPKWRDMVIAGLCSDVS